MNRDQNATFWQSYVDNERLLLIRAGTERFNLYWDLRVKFEELGIDVDYITQYGPFQEFVNKKIDIQLGKQIARGIYVSSLDFIDTTKGVALLFYLLVIYNVDSQDANDYATLLNMCIKQIFPRLQTSLNPEQANELSSYLYYEIEKLRLLLIG